jgi:hypothetical protein
MGSRPRTAVQYNSARICCGRNILCRLFSRSRRAQDAGPYQNNPEGGCDRGGDHAGCYTLRCPGRSGMQPRCTDPRGGTGRSKGACRTAGLPNNQDNRSLRRSRAGIACEIPVFRAYTFGTEHAGRRGRRHFSPSGSSFRYRDGRGDAYGEAGAAGVHDHSHQVRHAGRVTARLQGGYSVQSGACQHGAAYGQIAAGQRALH